MTERTEGARHHLFLSYASQDKDFAARLSSALRRAGASVWMDQFELQVGDSISEQVTKAISASDFLVVLLSPSSVNSQWVRKELSTALALEIHARDITVIPVVIEDCDVPAELATKHVIDLRRNVEDGIQLLVKQLGIAPSIDLSKIAPRRFEALVAELLERLGFYGIEREWILEGRHVDICARYSSKDPFGQQMEQVWLVEVKHYRRERAGVKDLAETVAFLSRLPDRYRGLLVLSSQLTSAARNWLVHASEQGHPSLRVIDGTELKKLLLKNFDLVGEYFGGAQS